MNDLFIMTDHPEGFDPPQLSVGRPEKIKREPGTLIVPTAFWRSFNPKDLEVLNIKTGRGNETSPLLVLRSECSDESYCLWKLLTTDDIEDRLRKLCEKSKASH